MWSMTGIKSQGRKGNDMSGQNTKLEEEPKQEKKTSKHREAGYDREGKPSAGALKSWLLWAGLAIFICLAVVCILAVVFSGQNRKEAAILEVDSDIVMKFTLNRKGTVLNVQRGDRRLLKTDLEECCQEILVLCLENGWLEEKEGVVFTIEACGEGVRLNAERMAEDICVYADALLKKKQAKGTVYVGVLAEDARIRSLAMENGCTLSKAALAADLVDENIRLKTADEKRLCSLSMGELSAEILEQKYNTSFSMVTAGKIYQKKASETVRVTEGKEEETSENLSEAEQEGTGSLTGSHMGAESGDGEESGQAQTEEAVETQPEGEEDAENRREEENEEIPAETGAVPETSVQESSVKLPTESVTEPVEPAASGTSEPETAAPETTVPSPLETPAPETTPPAAIVPETTVPEPVAPESTVPETSKPSAYYPSGSMGPGFETEPTSTDAVIQQVVPLSPESD